MGVMVPGDFFVDDLVVALAGVREDQVGRIVRTRRGQLVRGLRGRAPAERRGDDVRVRWERDRVATWYPAPLLAPGSLTRDAPPAA